MRSTVFSFVRCAIIILLAFLITLVISNRYINARQAYFKMRTPENNDNCEPVDSDPIQPPKESPIKPSSSTTTTTTSTAGTTTSIATASKSTASMTTSIATAPTAKATTAISNLSISTSVMEKSTHITTSNQTVSQVTSITRTQNGLRNNSSSMQYIFNTTLTPSASVNHEVVTKSASIRSENKAVTANSPAAKYFTLKFGGACSGRISNKIFEFVSAYGIARTLNRMPYVDLSFEAECAKKAFDEVSGYFPKLGQAFNFIMIHRSQVLTMTLDDVTGCCTYGNLNKLKEYASAQYLQLNTDFLQSYKYFHQYRQDVLKLFTFTDEDINATDAIAYGTFKDDKSHKICLHTRRNDFIGSGIHQESTEIFTKGSALYVQQKLRDQGRNATIALLGDDRFWLDDMIRKEPWAVVPPITDRPTTDYAFFARHCQTIILTGPASTFGIWSAYLSSAEKIYFNMNFTKSDQFRTEYVIDDYFPMEWMPLSQNKETGVITELPRSQ